METFVCGTCGRVFNAGEQVCPFDRTELRSGAPNASTDPLLGTELGGSYMLLERLGEGGMGVVYRARQTRLQRDVALKVLHPRHATPSAEVRFRKEALAASRLSNPHTVSIYDFGATPDGLLYLVMQLVEGESLHDVIQRGPMGQQLAVSIAAQVCESLAEAHGVQLVHRDIKPDNILVGANPSGEVFATVLDFGLAQLANSERLTTTGLVVGTPLYMAPELGTEGAAIDLRVDLYALGAVLHEMIAGHPPFVGKNAATILYRHMYEKPPRLSEVCAEPIAPELEQLVLELLTKDPAQRPGSAIDVRARLLQILSSIPSDPFPIDRSGMPHPEGPTWQEHRTERLTPANSHDGATQPFLQLPETDSSVPHVQGEAVYTIAQGAHGENLQLGETPETEKEAWEPTPSQPVESESTRPAEEWESLDLAAPVAAKPGYTPADARTSSRDPTEVFSAEGAIPILRPPPPEPPPSWRDRIPNLRAVVAISLVVLGVGIVVRHRLLAAPPPPATDPTAPVAAVPTPVPTPADPAASPTAATPDSAADPSGGMDCSGLVSARLRPLEVRAVRMEATMLGSGKATALLRYRGNTVPVQSGDYVGTHCWRVARIDDRGVTLTQEGASPPQTMRIAR